jgi:hypothetical protein
MSQNQNNEQSTGDQVLQLFSDPFKTEIQSSSIVTAFTLYLGLALGLTVLFSLVRPRHRLVYAPKTKHADQAHAPPPIGSGILSWIKPVTSAKESDLMGRIGLDAVLFVRFTRMLRNIFLAFGVVGLAIMLPVNVTQTRSSNANVGALLYMVSFPFRLAPMRLTHTDSCVLWWQCSLGAGHCRISWKLHCLLFPLAQLPKSAQSAQDILSELRVPEQPPCTNSDRP